MALLLKKDAVCAKCPHRAWKSSGKQYCFFEDKKLRQLPDEESQPDWCELPETPADYKVCETCQGLPKLGYLQWHIDAEERHKKGERQIRCPHCGLWAWPTLMKPLPDADE